MFVFGVTMGVRELRARKPVSYAYDEAVDKAIVSSESGSDDEPVVVQPKKTGILKFAKPGQGVNGERITSARNKRAIPDKPAARVK